MLELKRDYVWLVCSFEPVNGKVDLNGVYKLLMKYSFPVLRGANKRSFKRPIFHLIFAIKVKNMKVIL